jgi:5-methylcytosine-specific restriction endonuclease McrA
MAGRRGGPKTRCGNTWTEARFKSFIKGNLRSATRKWAPISNCLKEARVKRGLYLCNLCKQEVPSSIKNDEGKRIKNALVDHINPIVDPAVGFTNWDEIVDRMFCEGDNLQVLCHECHQKKSNEEKDVAKQRRIEEKEFDEEE